MARGRSAGLAPRSTSSTGRYSEPAQQETKINRYSAPVLQSRVPCRSQQHVISVTVDHEPGRKGRYFINRLGWGRLQGLQRDPALLGFTRKAAAAKNVLPWREQMRRRQVCLQEQMGCFSPLVSLLPVTASRYLQGTSTCSFQAFPARTFMLSPRPESWAASLGADPSPLAGCLACPHLFSDETHHVSRGCLVPAGHSSPMQRRGVWMLCLFHPLSVRPCTLRGRGRAVLLASTCPGSQVLRAENR